MCRLTIVCDTQYSVKHERDRSTRHAPAGAATRHRRARVPATARAAGLRLRPARGARDAAASTPTPTRCTPCCAVSRSRGTSRASGTPTRRDLASSTAPARRAPAWPRSSPTNSARSPRRSTHFPRRTDMNTSTLTDRYIDAAMRTVPEKQRADLAAELRASIDDQIDARVESGRAPRCRRARRAHRARRPRRARRRLHRPPAATSSARATT